MAMMAMLQKAKKFCMMQNGGEIHTLKCFACLKCSHLFIFQFQQLPQVFMQLVLTLFLMQFPESNCLLHFFADHKSSQASSADSVVVMVSVGVSVVVVVSGLVGIFEVVDSAPAGLELVLVVTAGKLHDSQVCMHIWLISRQLA